MLCLHERIELPASGMKGLKFEVGSIELLPAALQCAAQAARWCLHACLADTPIVVRRPLDCAAACHRLFGAAREIPDAATAHLWHTSSPKPSYAGEILRQVTCLMLKHIHV